MVLIRMLQHILSTTGSWRCQFCGVQHLSFFVFLCTTVSCVLMFSLFFQAYVLPRGNLCLLVAIRNRHCIAQRSKFLMFSISSAGTIYRKYSLPVSSVSRCLGATVVERRSDRSVMEAILMPRETGTALYGNKSQQYVIAANAPTPITVRWPFDALSEEAKALVPQSLDAVYSFLSSASGHGQALMCQAVVEEVDETGFVWVAFGTWFWERSRYRRAFLTNLRRSRTARS